jgi:signal peptidase II
MAIRRKGFAVIIGFIVFFADLMTKFWTHHFLPLMSSSSFVYPYGGIGIFKNFLGIEFSISHAINRGAAWGSFAEFQTILLGLRILLILGLTLYLFLFNKHPAQRIPLVLIITGASGNVVDYFLYGHVIDMFHFVLWGYDFPVFNVADSAIFLGISSLICITWLEQKKQQARP